MKITTHDPVVQTETTAYINHSEEFPKKYCIGHVGVMPCRECPLGTAETEYFCTCGSDEDCIEAIENFLEKETVMPVNYSEEFLKKYCVNGVVSCRKCPLDTEENIHMCPGGPDEACLEAIEWFLEGDDDDEVVATAEPDPIDPNGYTAYNVAIRQGEAVNHPSHYTSGKIECIDAIECAIDNYDDPKAAFLVGQVIKYLWRAPLKGAYRQDIEKAQWYLDRLVDQFGEKEGK